MEKRPRFGKDSTPEKEYWKAVREDVNGLFKNGKRKGGSKVKRKALLFLSIYFLGIFVIYQYGAQLSYLLVILIYMLVLGPSKAALGMNVLHEGSHETFSSKKWLNDLASATSILFVGGLPQNWRVEHVLLHHPYTNIYEADGDFSSGEVAVRFSRFAFWRKTHRLQKYRWYIFFVYCQMTLAWIILTDIKQTKEYLKLKEKGILSENQYPSKVKAWTYIALSKLFVISFWIVAPILLTDISPWLVIVGFILMHQVAGMVLSHIFQPAHINEYTKKYDNKDFIADGGVRTHQFLTSMDFATGNKLLTYFCGGLNYQKVHHLFQNYTHEHYPAITEIMRKRAREIGDKYPNFKLRYVEFKTFWEAIAANYRYVQSHAEEPISYAV